MLVVSFMSYSFYVFLCITKFNTFNDDLTIRNYDD